MVQIAPRDTTDVPVSAYLIQLPLNIVGVADIAAPLALRDTMDDRVSASRTPWLLSIAAVADIVTAPTARRAMMAVPDDASRTMAATAAIRIAADITAAAFPVLEDTTRWTEDAFETTRNGTLRLVGTDPHSLGNRYHI